MLTNVYEKKKTYYNTFIDRQIIYTHKIYEIIEPTLKYLRTIHKTNTVRLHKIMKNIKMRNKLFHQN